MRGWKLLGWQLPNFSLESRGAKRNVCWARNKGIRRRRCVSQFHRITNSGQTNDFSTPKSTPLFSLLLITTEYRQLRHTPLVNLRFLADYMTTAPPYWLLLRGWSHLSRNSLSTLIWITSLHRQTSHDHLGYTLEHFFTPSEPFFPTIFTPQHFSLTNFAALEHGVGFRNVTEVLSSELPLPLSTVFLRSLTYHASVAL